MKLLKTLSLSLFGLVSAGSFAQELTADIQLRPRYEYTNGFGTLLTPTTSHTSFVGQRSRLNLNYGDEKLKVKLSLQNVSVWGDHPTTAKSSVNGTAVFEGWAQYSFTENFSVKAGRQVLSYDNQRIIGGLDWATQGRSFDAAVATFKGAKTQLDLGVSLNEDNENKVDAATAFTTDHKNMQYAWFHTNADKFGISLLALNVGKETTALETKYIQTLGTYTTYKGKKFNADLSFYYQTGETVNGTVTDVSAYEAAINLGYAFTPTFKATAGYEYLSGKDYNDASAKTKTFAPLFGTNHAHNGFMDYFYVGFGNKTGLQDINLKLDFPIGKVKFALQPHVFLTAADLSATDDSYLGTEVDLTAVYKLHKDITLIGGYSQMFGSDSMEVLKGGIADTTNNWAYLMVNINPQIFSTKK
jgi:hypothetical protein